MQQYLRGIAAVMNILLFLVALGQVLAMTGPIPDGKQLLLILLVLVTPAFTLIALFAPAKVK